MGENPDNVRRNCLTADLDKSASIEIMSIDCSGERRTLRSTFHAFVSKCLMLTTSERVALSTAVAVEYNDVLFMGEVMRCIPAGNQWDVEIKVGQTLTGLESLMILRSELEQYCSVRKDVFTASSRS